MHVVPLADRVVVQRDKAKEKSEGGIILPDQAKQRPTKGKVLAVGPGRLLDSGQRAPMETKVGDVVLFSAYSGSEVEVDGEDVTVMREDDILGKIAK